MTSQTSLWLVVLPIVISVAALAVSIVSANFSRANLRLSALSKLTEEAFSPELREAHFALRGPKFRDYATYHNYILGPGDKDEKFVVDQALNRLIRFYDTLGVYVEQGILSRNLVIGIVGQQIVDAYKSTAFYCEAKPAGRNETPSHFRRLAAQARRAGLKPSVVVKAAEGRPPE